MERSGGCLGSQFVYRLDRGNGDSSTNAASESPYQAMSVTDSVGKS